MYLSLCYRKCFLQRDLIMFFKMFFFAAALLVSTGQGWMDCCSSKLPNRYGFNPLEFLSENEIETNSEELNNEESPLSELEHTN